MVLRVPGTARRSNQSILKEISPECSLDWCWSWNSSTLATWGKELTHLKRPWCWERLRAGEEGNNRGWDGWMASPTQWTWVWVDPGSWWWTGRPGVLRFMELQTVGHDWVTEQNRTGSYIIISIAVGPKSGQDLIINWTSLICVLTLNLGTIRHSPIYTLTNIYPYTI